jgi:hypothetical protein
MGQTAEAFGNDGITAGDPYVAYQAAELKLVPPLSEEPTAEQDLTTTDRVVLSFNHHPVLDTTVASMALAGIGVVAGAVVFSRRR